MVKLKSGLGGGGLGDDPPPPPDPHEARKMQRRTTKGKSQSLVVQLHHLSGLLVNLSKIFILLLPARATLLSWCSRVKVFFTSGS
jgi:hypothetical protein